jgi:hypothetical protein
MIPPGGYRPLVVQKSLLLGALKQRRIETKDNDRGAAELSYSTRSHHTHPFFDKIQVYIIVRYEIERAFFRAKDDEHSIRAWVYLSDDSGDAQRLPNIV